jgi:hypothetical protein
MYVTKFLQLNTKRHLRKNLSTRGTTDYRKAKKIGIVFSTEGIEKHNAVKTLVKDLQEDGKEVTVISFLPPGKQNHEFLFDIISPNDISFWGSLQNEDAKRFADESFDYLLDLDTNSNEIIDNILAMSKAKCRVGIYHEKRDPYFELMINPKNPDSVQELIKDIHHYTKKITVNGE